MSLITAVIISLLNCFFQVSISLITSVRKKERILVLLCPFKWNRNSVMACLFFWGEGCHRGPILGSPNGFLISSLPNHSWFYFYWLLLDYLCVIPFQNCSLWLIIRWILLQPWSRPTTLLFKSSQQVSHSIRVLVSWAATEVFHNLNWVCLSHWTSVCSTWKHTRANCSEITLFHCLLQILSFSSSS
jgi:hypothetical protein